MNINSFSPLIENHINSLPKEQFNTLCLRLLTKIEPDNGFATSTDTSIIENGCSVESVFYISFPNSENSIKGNRTLLPKDSTKFSFITIFTNHSDFNDELNIKSFVSQHSSITVNVLNPEKLSQQISSFEAEDIKFILGENSTISHYIYNTQNNDRNRNIIKTILDFLFDTSIINEIKPAKETDNKFVHITEKIEINLGRNQREVANNLYSEHLADILLIQEFMKSQASLDNRPINALIDRIQKLYCEEKGVDYHDEIIHNLNIFDNLAERIIPTEHKDSPEYHYSAKSIVLFFFEFCFIGSKTKQEEQQSFFKRLTE